jgi:hypothetical protein
MQNHIQELMAAFRQRLIDRLSTNRPGDYASKSLPELYAMAAKRFPCLHQDVELCTLYTALGRPHSGSVAQGDVEVLGIDAWMDAGMSPVIYFTGSPRERRVPLNFIEQMGVRGAPFPDRERLLGNLTLAEFSHCLADRVSFNRINYYWMRMLTAVMPELLEPENWKNLTTGHIRVKEKFRKRKGEPLQALLPLLLIEAGKDPGLHHQAKHSLNIVDPLAIASVTRQACHDTEGERGITILEQYVGLEYGGWDAENLDSVLHPYIINLDFGIRNGIGQGAPNEQFWISKAFELVTNPASKLSTWPAALYARYLMYCYDSDATIEQQILQNLLISSPKLKRIQEYVIASGLQIIEAVIDTDDFFMLVHPLLIAQFNEADRPRFIENAARRVAYKIIHELKKESYFVLDQRACDPDCLRLMSQMANETVSLEGLDLTTRGHQCMLKLMSAGYMGEENRERAIAWCVGLSSQKTRLEAMQLLDLTLDDVSLTPDLHDEFLSRDLGI